MSRGQDVQCQHFTWRLYIRGQVYYADGRKKSRNLGRHSLGTRDRDEAIKALAGLDLAIAIDAGLADPKSLDSTRSIGPSIAVGRQQYEEHLNRPNVAGGPSESTRKRYRPVFDHFVDYCGRHGIANWEEVTDRLVEKYLAERSKAGAAPRTLYLEGTLLKQLNSFLILKGALSERSRLRMQLTKPSGTSTVCWTPEQVEMMRSHCYQDEKLHWIGDIVTGLARTGLRISELLNLRWGDISLGKNDGVLQVVNDVGAAHPGLESRRTKGRRSRSLPIHPDLHPVFQRRRMDGHGFIFRGPHGGRLKPDDVRQAFVKRVLIPLAKVFPMVPGERGFGDGRLHSFRHFFVSQAANSGVPIKVVQEWLGHRDSAMVSHYFHLCDRESQNFMRRVKFSAEEDQGCVALDSSVA